jgi:hypothetical protein
LKDCRAKGWFASIGPRRSFDVLAQEAKFLPPPANDDQTFFSSFQLPVRSFGGLGANVEISTKNDFQVADDDADDANETSERVPPVTHE